MVCPNLTIKERLNVLRPGDPNNYYEQFDIVPSSLRPELAKGKVLVTNWHWLAPEAEVHERRRRADREAWCRKRRSVRAKSAWATCGTTSR